ncbi:MAG: c-type cytochrome [Rhodospirillales bacterium]
MAISPDGTQVLSGSFDYSLRLWDFESQSERAVLEGHDGPVNAVSFSPDGKLAVSASDDRSALIWHLAAGQALRRLEGHDHKVMTAAFSPDGRLVATGSWDRMLRVWHPDSGQLVRAIETPSPINAVAFVKGRDWLVSGHHDGFIRLWRLSDGGAAGHLEGQGFAVTRLAITADGRHLLSAGIDRALRIWDLESLTELAAYKPHDANIFAACFTPDGERVLSAGKDGHLLISDPSTGEVLRDIAAHDAMVWDLAVTPDGRFAITASGDETLRVWHLQTGDRIGVETAAQARAEPWLTSDHPGARVYAKCARCHDVTEGASARSGPTFAGLFGRRAGSVADYHYSRALAGSDLIWDEGTLKDLFRQGPDRFLPGTKMPLQRITDEDRLDDLIAYMRQLTAVQRQN